MGKKMTEQEIKDFDVCSVTVARGLQK